MNLVINNPESVDLTEFCNWLIIHMQEYIRKYLNEKHLIRVNEYLNTDLTFKTIYQVLTPLSAKDILIGSTYNLRVKKQLDRYIIEINPNITIPNTSAKFINIVKLINDGNLIINGYPIYDEMMQYFANNIDYYFNEYLEE